MGHRGSPRGRWKRERRDAKDQTAQVDADGSASPSRPSALLFGLLMRYDIETLRLAMRLLECQHERAIEGARYCGDCGRPLP